MKKIIYVAMAAVLLSSCTGVAPFSKSKYGHLKWIKKGAVIEEKTTQIEPCQAPVKSVSVKTTVTPDHTILNTSAENNQTTSPTAGTPSSTATSQDKTTAPVVNHNTAEETQTAETNTLQEKTIKRAGKKPAKPGMDGTVKLIIGILLCLILPPFGVYLYRETGSPFIICLILCLIALIGFWFYALSGLLWLIAVILALLAVLQDA